MLGIPIINYQRDLRESPDRRVGAVRFIYFHVEIKYVVQRMTMTRALLAQMVTGTGDRICNGIWIKDACASCVNTG